MFSLPWFPVESLVGELGSYTPCSVAKKTKNKTKKNSISKRQNYSDLQNVSVSGYNIHYCLVDISVLVVKEASLLSDYECPSIRLKEQPSQLSIQAYIKRQLLAGKFLEMVLRIKDWV